MNPEFAIGLMCPSASARRPERKLPPVHSIPLASGRSAMTGREMRKNKFHRFRPRKSRVRPWGRGVRRFGWGTFRLTTIGIAFAGLIGVSGWQFVAGSKGSTDQFSCTAVRVIDGDTFVCDGRRVRLQGIDAPELAGHCRPGRQCTPGDGPASTESLARLVSWNTVQCRPVDVDAYGRTVARCTAGKRDLSCAQLDADHAVRRYGVIFC